MTATQHPSDRQTSPNLTQTSDAPGLRWTLVGLLGFVGLGGVYGGVQMLADPYGPMGMSTPMIARTPFDSFAVPGVLLLLLVGVTPLLLAVTLLGPRHPHPGWVMAFGIGLMAWIMTQWVLIDERLWLQPAIFSVGLVISLVAGLLWRRQNRDRERAATP